MPGIRVRRTGSRRNDAGYMLLLLMVAVAVLTITMLGVALNYKRSILRDREIEMIHRGEQYERAVKRYYKKTGGFPTSLEQLENTNNIRYLRKKYKDPMSPDGSWQLVHLTDMVKIKTGSGLGSGTGLPGSSGSAVPAASGTLGSTSTANSAEAAAGGGNDTSQAAGGSTVGTGTGSTGGSATAGTTASTGGSDTGSTGTGIFGSNPAGGGVLGGGPVLGVVSKAAGEGIHSFGSKTKYTEWYFIYDPSQDTGKSLMVGPYNPNMFIGGAAAANNAGNPGSSFGTTPSSGAPGTVPSPSTSAPSTSAPSVPSQSAPSQ